MSRPFVFPSLEPDTAQFLGQKLGLRPLTGQLLINRGIRTEEEARLFLQPRLSDLRPPEGIAPMAGFTKAIERLKAAVMQKELIGIFGDYDVDGVTTCAILTDFLRGLGVKVIPRIARRNEGYGFSISDAKVFLSEGCSLIITGDCGTSDHDALAVCKEAGADVIVVDHHQVPDRMPDALALLNPHQPGCVFPFKGLASVGVAFYLIAALRTRLKQEHWPDLPELRSFLDLVALGTVADLAPLTQENRILVSIGLRELQKTTRLGLQDLALLAGLPGGASSVADIAFRLAPRLNAPGRLGNSEDALGVLLEKDPFKAREYANACHDLNLERQQIQKHVFEEARKEANHWIQHSSAEVLVLAKEGWHSGVVGIVAAKLVEEYERPVIVIALEEGLGRGSARTTHGFHVYKGLKQAADLLIRYGGHAAAAGLVVPAPQIHALRDALCAAYHEQLGNTIASSTLVIESAVHLEEIDPRLIEEFSLLGPFGMGNPEPLLLVEDAELSDSRIVGKDHLQIKLRKGLQEEQGIGFGLAKKRPSLPLGAKVQAAFIPEFDTYYARSKRIRLRLKELYPIPAQTEKSS